MSSFEPGPNQNIFAFALGPVPAPPVASYRIAQPGQALDLEVVFWKAFARNASTTGSGTGKGDCPSPSL